MQITNILFELQTSMANIYANNLKNENPKNLDEVAKLFNNLAEVSIHLLRENPEFRTQFARVHAEFLKYPESRQVIEDSIQAYKKINEV
ncbi:MAG: hypothetical protein FH751_07595 [Firmicutes bacterium]|nr:hypothetical protein [Bacillota bacterium]